ncbi:hypothetical protein FB451DRAFT_1375291 [Mycena latifolia]|nr:hypothetical protein FB451DRAFT_1375291 [Mycena latifolia]
MQHDKALNHILARLPPLKHSPLPADSPAVWLQLYWRSLALPLIGMHPQSADSPQTCAEQRDDYIECVHRTKEAQALKDHKKDLDGQADGGPTRLGLIPTPPV